MSSDQSGGCECLVLTASVVGQSRDCLSNLSTSTQESIETMFLGDMLILGQNLIKQWELLNSCVNSETHLNTSTLRLMVDAISRIIRLYETAIEGRRKATSSLEPGKQQQQQQINNHNSENLHHPLIGEPSTCRSTSTSTLTFLGCLELDDEEADIVAQEALRDSLIRLGVMIHDIEDETRQRGPCEDYEGDQHLEDREIKGLVTKLFRLMGKVSMT